MQARHTPSIERRRTSRGFSLAEALIASVFLAVAALGVAGTLSAASSEAQHVSHMSNCQALARELMEEISSKSFAAQANPGYSAGTTDRSTYDNAADYSGYTDSTANAGGIKTLQGTTVAFGDGGTYTRTVAFEYRATPNGAAAGSGDFAMVTVTVTSNAGARVQLQRLLSSTMVKRS